MKRVEILDRIRQFILPPQFDDPEKNRRAQLLNFIAWSSLFIIAYLLTRRLNLFDVTTFTLEALFLLILINIWAIHRGYLRAASVFLVLSSWCAMALVAYIGSGVRDTAVTGELIIVIMCGLLLGWKAAAGLSLLSIADLWIMVILETNGGLRVTLDTTYGVTRDLTAAFLLAGILIYLTLNNFQRYLSALHSSEERFRKFFHASPLAIAIVTLEEGRFMEANDAFWKLSGLNPDQAIGHTPVEFGLWQSSEERHQFVEELKEKRSIQNMNYVFVSQSKELHDTLAFYELIELENQSCILATFYDVTEERKVQEELRRSEMRNRALLNAIPDMIFEMDRNGAFVNYFKSDEINPTFPPDQFMGKNIREVMPESVSSPALFGIERALMTNQTFAFEYQLPGKEGVHDYEARLIATNEDHVLAIIRDITARKWAETEREALINELESKNAELERFTYTVSHDLKAPLITIKGFLAYLREDAKKEDMTSLQKDIQRISDASEKMQNLLNELLELSRIGRLVNPSEDIPFETLAREAVELVQGNLQGRHVQVLIQPGLPRIYGDHPRFTEMLQNLIDNAAKFTRDRPDPRIEIGLHNYAEDGKPVFFVKDNGIGIAPEFHERVFGLFNKLDAQTEGTGVGLAIVKRIVELHGGQIWIESEAGQGATFFFSLPQKPQS